MRKVFLITGPPGSGKSFYVHQQAKENDVCFDLDKIHEALSNIPGLHRDRKCLLGVSLPMRDAFFSSIAARKGAWENAYIITGAADRGEIERLINLLHAEEVRIEKPISECAKNIQNDSTREDKAFQLKRLQDWFSACESDPGGKTTRDLFADWWDAQF